MRNTSTSNQFSSIWVLIAVVLLLGAVVRIYNVDNVDFRGDEAFTAIHWAQTPFTSDWFELLRNEPHPFPVFLLYSGWTSLAGTSELAFRLVPAFSSIVGTAAIIVLAKRWLKCWTPALLAGLLWVLNPFLLYHAQDARNFSMSALFAVLAVYWFWRGFTSPERMTIQAWVPYIIVQVGGIYIYFFELFTLVVLGLFWLVQAWQQPQLRRVGLRIWLVIGVLLLPLSAQFFVIIFLTTYEGTATNTELIAVFERFIPTLWFGDNTAPALYAVLFLVGMILGLMLIRQQWATLLILWTVVPLTLLIIMSNFSAVFRPRYIIHSSPAFIVGLLAVTFTLPKRQLQSSDWTNLITVASVLLVIGVSALEIRDYFVNDPPKAPDWRGLTDYLEARTNNHDVVIISEPDPAIEYYFEGNIYYIPVDNANPVGDFERLLQTYDGIYVLSGTRTGPAAAFLQQEAQLIRGDTYPGILQARSWVVNPREIEVSLAVTFGDIALLRGYTVLNGERGGAVLMLYWEALRPTVAEHSILTHIVAVSDSPQEQPLVLSLDHGVANSIVSTTTWSGGTIYRDVVAIPTLTVAEVQVLVGMYPTADPSTLLTASGIDILEETLRYVLPEKIRVMP